MLPVSCIDIGSNSVLLTVAVRDGDWVREITTGEAITRLGAGLSRNVEIGSEAMDATIVAVTEFVHRARTADSSNIRLVGTQALRKASNASALGAGIHRATGLVVEIISGEEESRLSFLAADRSLMADKAKIVADVGGGSTEVIFGQASKIKYSTSMPLGCVSLSERFPYPQDRAGLRQFLNACLNTDLPAPKSSEMLVAIGGTATALAAIHLKLPKYDPQKVHGHRLPAQWIAAFADEFAAKPESERLAIPYASPQRLKVLEPGIEVLLALMRRIGIAEAIVSDAGLRHAVAWEMLAGSVPKC